MIEAVPLRRLSTPAEIVPAMLFLTSAVAFYVTGHGLSVDGGLNTLR